MDDLVKFGQWLTGLAMLGLAICLNRTASVLARIPGRVHLPAVWCLACWSDDATLRALELGEKSLPD